MTRRHGYSIAVALGAVLLTGTGIAWASGITLTSKSLGASSVTTPTLFPESVTLTNKVGPPAGTVGRVGNGDVITFVWSRQIDLPTLCSAATNGMSPLTTTYKWSI